MVCPMRYWLKLLISLLILAVLLWRVDVGAVMQALLSAAPGGLALASLLFFLVHGVNAARLRVLLPEVPFGRLLSQTLVAQLYALVLPGQVAGEVVKAYRLSRGAVEAERVVSAVAFDKLTGLAGLLLLTAGGLAVQRQHFGSGLLLLVGLVLASLGGVAMLCALDRPRRIILRLLAIGGGPRREAWLLAPARRFLDAWAAQMRRPGRAGLSVLCGILAQFCAVAGSQALGLAVGIDQPFSVWAAVIGLMSVIVLAPVTIGGIGLREASLIGLLDLVGVGHDAALVLGLGILAFQLMVALCGALIDMAAPNPGSSAS